MQPSSMRTSGVLTGMEPANTSDLLTPELKGESKNEMEPNIIEFVSMVLICFLLNLFSRVRVMETHI